MMSVQVYVKQDSLVQTTQNHKVIILIELNGGCESSLKDKLIKLGHI